MIERHRAAGGSHPALSGPQRRAGRKLGGRPPSGKPRASDLGDDAQGRLDQVKKIDSLSNEGSSEQSSLLGMAEFNIKGNVINGDCCCPKFAWLDSVVIQPCAHLAQE